MGYKTYYYGQRSTGRLDTCHVDLQRVAHKALEISPVDIAIICGLRSMAEQEEAYANGFSKVRWPSSKHNGQVADGHQVSFALDFAPWIHGTINWRDEGSFYGVAMCFLAAGKILGIDLRYGGDWDRDGLTEDQSFMDIGHVELFGY